MPKLPTELTAFIEKGFTTFQSDDGDWELRVEAQKDNECGEHLPARSMVIAENGSGDYLFLKLAANGKYDPKVHVYWHEEERHEVFAKRLAELIQASIDGSAKTVANPATISKSKSANDSDKSGKRSSSSKPDGKPIARLEAALGSPKTEVRTKTMRDFAESEFGLDALPVLRRALDDTWMEVVLIAAKCIAKLGPAAMEAPDAESAAEYGHADLTEQLMRAGAKVWSASGYPNAYSACIEALVALEADEELVYEHIHNYIGLSDPDDLLTSLEALKALGSRKALDLLKRAVTFWLPELNLAGAKKVKAIVATAGKSK
jgi:hypothetical protein